MFIYCFEIQNYLQLFKIGSLATTDFTNSKWILNPVFVTELSL